jgi:hypothetical protein
MVAAAIIITTIDPTQSLCIFVSRGSTTLVFWRAAIKEFECA